MAGGVVIPGAIPTTDIRSRPVAAALAGERWDAACRWLLWGAFGLIVALATLAPIARTGDAHQYYAMATALADLRPPSLTSDEVAEFKAWLQAQPAGAEFAGSVRAVDQPPLVVSGRQEFSHFWLYPLLAAPVIALTNAVELHPGYAFVAVNAALLGVALGQVQRAYPVVVGLLVLASPLIWFVNKAQVEIFTVSLLAVAMAQAGRGRWLGAGLAAAVASTQNAPLLAAVACFWGAGLLRQLLIRQWPRLTGGGLLFIAATVVIGALHPAYYLWRLGVLTPQQLNGGIDLGLPSPERYVAVLLDPDIGLLFWLPLTALLAVAGLPLLWQRGQGAVAPPTPQSWGENGGLPSEIGAPGSSARLPTITQVRAQTVAPPRIGGPGGRSGGPEGRSWKQARRPEVTLDWRLAAPCGLVIGAWLLFVFAQTTNVNSGGTVHISRYALWLLPLALPLLAATADWLRPRLPALLPVTGGVALLLYAALFQPVQAERYVIQSPQAALLTTWLPELYRTVPEIFYERQHQLDGGVRGSAATTNCRVILLHVDDRELPCPLDPSEAQAAANLFASGWHVVWITQPGPLGLGEGRVTGVLTGP